MIVMNKYDLTKQKTLAELCVKKDSRIDELSAYIKYLANHSDICTKRILGEVCDGCRCVKAGKINPAEE
jgi:hypothetical protein